MDVANVGLETSNAVFKGDIDANVMRHIVFLESYNERQHTDLVGIVDVPTPSMGLYSKKHALGTQIKAGSAVVVPNDPVNPQRLRYRRPANNLAGNRTEALLSAA